MKEKKTRNDLPNPRPPNLRVFRATHLTPT
jgi:hypothetical protein